MDDLRPYALAAKAYVAAGWLGALPLPPRQKEPVPAGYTGKRHYDIDPTMGDIDSWLAQDRSPGFAGRGNIGLRMPRDVIGIDVDAYEGKDGAKSLERAEQQWGPLPPTHRLTSRTDGISGIRFFQVPEDMWWPNDVGPGIEMIHRGHRYAVAWPSIHPAGGLYQWFDPSGQAMTSIPRPSDLAYLPQAWLEGLTHGMIADEATTHADLGNRAAEVVKSFSTNGTMCPQVEAKLEQALTAVYTRAGGRHDATRDHALAILYYGQQGHSGVDLAMAQLRDAFMSEVGKDRGQDKAGPEFDRLVEGAAEIIAASPRPVEVCGGQDCGRKLQGLPADVLPEVVPRSILAASEALGVPEDQDALFWAARPVLSHILAYARARRVSPWALLGVTLVRVTCATGPALVLPPLRGGEASLNMFVGLVGPSGSGKGAAEAAGREAFSFGVQVEAGVGSGEGLVKSFIRWVPGKKGDPEPGHYDLHTQSVLFRASEVDTLAALKGRQGSTLLPLLRDAWSGDTLGFAYASEEKRVNLPAHAYRLGLVVGIQPNRAHALLEEADGGTPQRFLWMPSTDPLAPRNPPECPDTWNLWSAPSWRHLTRSTRTGRYQVQVCQTARDEVDENYLRQARGDVAALDGHSLLARLKVAAALGLLDNRASVTDADWTLAGVVMTKSDATRLAVQRSLSAVKKEAEKARTDARIREAEKLDEALDAKARGRLSQNVLGKLSSEWVSGAALRRKIAAKHRADLEPTLDALVASGQVEVQEVEYNGQTGLQYRLNGARK